MNICEHLTATARIQPDHEALAFEGEHFSYAEINRLTAAAAARLSADGIERGDRVALMLPNTPSFAVWYYGALRIGAIAVSISTRLTQSETFYLLEDSGSRCFVISESASESASEADEFEVPDCVRHSYVANDRGDLCDRNPLVTEEPLDADWLNAEPNDAALILYTSGTTGFAKGATLSHLNVRSNVHAFNHLCDMRTDDRILLAVPLFHCFGQNALLNSALNAGATLILQRRFDLNEARRLIQEQRVTQLYGVPMMFQLLMEACSAEELASVRYCFSAAAPLPIQISERWEQKFGQPIHEGYGLTETSPFASYNHRSHYMRGSIGTPIDCVEMRIVDIESGQPVPPGSLGEITIRGPNVMLGYWNREADTAEVIRDGWFHSGDIGRVDETGYFQIVDRVKDMIAVGGMKVYPAEVERILMDHPAVNDVAVIGIPDDVFGEQVVACTVLRDQDEASAVHSEDVTESILQHARRELSNYKVPRSVLSLGELPRNPSGKILKTKLRETAAIQLENSDPAEQSQDGASSQHGRSSSVTPAVLMTTLRQTHEAARVRAATQFVQELVQQIAEIPSPPAPDARFLDAGLDSLMIVEMSQRLQHELGPDREIPATLVFDYPRVTDLAEFLVGQLAPPETEPPPDRQSPAKDSAASQLKADIESLSEDEALSELMKELDD